jgi:hypothetical protein
MLQNEGNWHLQFITFSGGHEYLEQNVRDMYLWMRQYVKRDINTEVDQAGGIPDAGLRVKCYPSPVTTAVNIVFSGPPDLPVDICLYDIQGRLADRIAMGLRISGEQTIAYDASELKPGVYMVRINSDDQVAESKMVVIR